MVPPSAASNFPFLCAAAPVKEPFLVAEHLRFEQCFCQSGAGHRDERLLRAVSGVVDGARDQLLPGAALALDEHRASQAGDVADELEDLLHPGMLADDVVAAVLAGQLLAKDAVLALQVLDLDDPLHQQRDLRRVERLDDVILRAFLHRSDRGVDRCVGRNDDDGSARADLVDLRHGLDAVEAAGHPQVDEADRVVSGLRLIDGLASRAGRLSGIAILPQPRRERFAHDLFVVNDQDLPMVLHETVRVDSSIPAWAPASLDPPPARGKVTMNLVPSPPRLSTVMSPP